VSVWEASVVEVSSRSRARVLCPSVGGIIAQVGVEPGSDVDAVTVLFGDEVVVSEWSMSLARFAA
jgi:hypothetical protein